MRNIGGIKAGRPIYGNADLAFAGSGLRKSEKI